MQNLSKLDFLVKSRHGNLSPKGSRKTLIGKTLAEVLVASFLVSLLLLILLRLASLVYRVCHEEIERGATEANVLLAWRTLEQDLVLSSPPAVSIQNDGSKVMIQPIDTVTPSRRVVFEPRFVYWTWEAVAGQSGPGKRLRRSAISSRPDGIPFDGNPFRWTEDQLIGLPVGTGADDSKRFDEVTQFTVANPNGVILPNVGSPLSFEIEMKLKLASTRKTIHLKRTLQLRTAGT